MYLQIFIHYQSGSFLNNNLRHVCVTGIEVGGFQRLVEVCLSSNIGKLFCSSELEVNALPSAADNLKSSSSTKRNQKEGAKLKK